MEQRIFIIILYLVQLLRAALTPILILLLFPFSKKLKKRINFEMNNLSAPESKSFALDQIIADVAFEVSSEGEFEQVKPLIDYYLKSGKKIEIVYSSDSLEKRLEKLGQEHSNLRAFRLPLASFGLFQNILMQTQNVGSWLTSPLLILCRYDFFPELLLYGMQENHRFCLVSATLKNKNLKSWFLKRIYNLFDYILSATPRDDRDLGLLGLDSSKHSNYEFRIIQIAKRLSNKDEKLDMYKDVVNWLEEVPRHKRIVLGSAWPLEMDIFKDKEFIDDIKRGEYRILILPHLFSEDFETSLINTPSYLYKDGDEFGPTLAALKESPGILRLHVKGILCELYGLCGHAFVGGGHGRSVHSVLEPFLAGCQIYCGPKTHRSTEYEFIKETSPDGIVVISELESFYKTYKKSKDENLVARREELSNSFVSEFKRKVDLLDGSATL